MNSLVKEFPDRWKFVDELTVVETCYRNLVSKPMSMFNDIEDDADDIDVGVIPSKFMIMPICFHRTSFLFLKPIPPNIFVASFKLLVVTFSSNLM